MRKIKETVLVKMKKRRINSEILYLIAILVLSFSIDLMTIANMGYLL